jgi:hypothetical protein
VVMVVAMVMTVVWDFNDFGFPLDHFHNFIL